MKVDQSGSALLAVLWLVACLSAIAFTLATTVRTETDRTSTDIDALKTYYLATGAVERALLYMEWGSSGGTDYYIKPTPLLRFQFATGEAFVDIIPESAKLNVNTASPEDLMALLLTLGVESGRAQTIAAGIVDWRTASPGGFTAFDQYYLSLGSSFHSRHASFQEIEELLMVRGVTPDLFHGGYQQDAQGNLIPHAGLKDCLSVWGGNAGVDVNTAEPAVLQAIGIDPGAVAELVAARRRAPIRNMEQLAAFRSSGPASQRLSLSAGNVYTLRATARLKLGNGKLSDLRRTVASTIKLFGLQSTPPHVVLRWQDNAYSASEAAETQ